MVRSTRPYAKDLASFRQADKFYGLVSGFTTKGPPIM